MKNLIITLCILFLWTACSQNTKNEDVALQKKPNNIVQLTANQLKNIELSTIGLENRNMSFKMKAQGKIDVPPQNLVSISAPLGGYLKSTHLLPGMPIKKGEVIAVLEDQQYIQLQQDYLLTQSKLLYAEKEFIRQKELNQNQASSDKVMQQTESEYNNLRIILRGLAEKLSILSIDAKALTEKNLSKNASLFSPISGFVSKVNVNIGRYVNPTDVLFELVNPSDIHLNMNVYEKDLSNLEIGQRVFAYTNSKPNKKHLCEIILISKDVSSEGTTEVHCHFEDYDKSLFPGMYMNAEIELKSAQTFVLPEECLVDFNGKKGVFIQGQNLQFELLEVLTGKKEDGYLEILNADRLKDQKIIVKGSYTLLMALKNQEEN